MGVIVIITLTCLSLISLSKGNNLPLLLERAGVRRIKIRKMLYFDPLILTPSTLLRAGFSRWEKGHSSLT